MNLGTLWIKRFFITACILLPFIFLFKFFLKPSSDSDSNDFERLVEINRVTQNKETFVPPLPIVEESTPFTYEEALKAAEFENYELSFSKILIAMAEMKNPSELMRLNASRIATFYARELRSLGQLGKALKVLDQAILWHEDKGYPISIIAQILLDENKIDEAAYLFDEQHMGLDLGSNAMQIRAEIYRLQGDSVKAAELMRKAFELAPNRSYLGSRAQQLEAEAVAFKDYIKTSTAHFDVYFDAQNIFMSRNIDDLLQDLEMAWADITKALSLYTSQRIVVLFLLSDDYSGQAPDWSAGLYDGRVRVLVDDYPEKRPQILSVMKHELSHALLHSLDVSLPTWLHEGLAQLYEPRDVQYARLSLRGKSLFSLQELNGSWLGWENNERVYGAYAYSLSFCEFVISQYGTNVFQLLVENCRGKQFEDAWHATFGWSLVETNERHINFIHNLFKE